MNLYQNDAQEYVWAEARPSEEYWEVQTVREGDLPTWMTDAQIDEWLSSARIVEGSWCGPVPQPEDRNG